MNDDTISGGITDIAGKGKEAAGALTGSPSLRAEGQTDQLTGKSQKLVGKVKDFARERPVLATTLAGVLGVAFLNTLRGRDR